MSRVFPDLDEPLGVANRDIAAGETLGWLNVSTGDFQRAECLSPAPSREGLLDLLWMAHLAKEGGR